MDVPEVGTIVNGVGDEIILGVCVVLVVVFGLVCIPVVWKMLPSASVGHLVHPALVPTVQRTRREMGVASEESTEAHVPAENCPVCLGTLENPIQTNCGHQFCAQCVLEYWRHDQWPRPTRCPICRRTVTLLLGTVTNEDLRDQVVDYNQRMSGEWRSPLNYLYDLPTILRHLWRDLFSERGPYLVRRLYLGYVLVFIVLYLLSPFDIIPESVFGLLGYFDDLVIALILIVYCSFLYRTLLTERT